MPVARRSCAVVAAFTLLSTLGAQQSPFRGPSGPVGMEAQPALAEQSDGLWGCGGGYKVRFDAGGFTFVPAFGATAPRNFSVRYELAACGRGTALQDVGAADRRDAGLRVEYARAAVTERYDLRADGLEQSFVLTALPAGDGDLVVRGRLSTELAVTAAAGGLQFTLPGVGACTLGGVTGIDAAGRTVAGEVRYHDGIVDYVLPAAFVANAQLPLVVDPLLGNASAVANTGNGEQDPDVAFDATNGVYLVVFEYVYSATDTDLYAQRVGTDGTLVGARILIEGSGQNDIDPQVANVALRDRFVVVWSRQTTNDSDVLACSVDAATGARGPVLAIASGADSQGWADVAGEATDADQDAICVWDNTTQDRIEAAQIGVNGDGTIFVQDLTTIVTGSVLNPRIGKSGGTTGRQLIVWMREYSLGDYDPTGAIVDRELTTLAGPFTFDSAVNFTGRVEADGDGESWIAAWHVKEASTAQNDVAARSVHFVSPGVASLGSGITLVSAVSAVNESNPSVCWTGNSTLVAYESSASAGSSANYVHSIDSFSCADCEGRTRVVTSLTDDYAICGASRRSGGEAVDEALFAVERRGANFDVLATRWRSIDGDSAVVQPGCGSKGGITYASCARAGYAGFAVRCVDAEPNTTAILVLSRSQSSIVCGPCRFVPDPYAGYLHFTTTSGAGSASFAAAIPASVAALGLGFYLQWIVVEPVTPGCYLFGSDLSTAIRTVIE
jgi:hypothetical protein